MRTGNVRGGIDREGDGCAERRSDPERADLAKAGAIVLLHPLLTSVVILTGTRRGRQQIISVSIGYADRVSGELGGADNSAAASHDHAGADGLGDALLQHARASGGRGRLPVLRGARPSRSLSDPPPPRHKHTHRMCGRPLRSIRGHARRRLSSRIQHIRLHRQGRRPRSAGCKSARPRSAPPSAGPHERARRWRGGAHAASLRRPPTRRGGGPGRWQGCYVSQSSWCLLQGVLNGSNRPVRLLGKETESETQLE